MAAVKKLDYRPNTIARSLRTRQTFTIGVIVPELSEGYFTMVMNGVEEYLMQAGYLHYVVCRCGRLRIGGCRAGVAWVRILSTPASKLAGDPGGLPPGTFGLKVFMDRGLGLDLWRSMLLVPD
jgi:hypothetical protein